MSDITIEQIREHLQWAIELEHGTLPPYLCALYSIEPGRNQEAAHVMTSIFVEEMLHMTLAANVLNAIGGAPAIAKPGFIPRYPMCLPHSAIEVLIPLAPFSRETVETFVQLEKPESTDARPEEDQYETIGQFYRAIEEGLKELCARMGEKNVFCGDPARQVTPEMLHYFGSGRIVPVYDLASALAAIDEIEEQGEGLKHAEVWDGYRDMFHPEREEVAHYFRLVEILEGHRYRRGDTPTSGPSGDSFDVDWTAVAPMRANPRMEDFPEGSPVRLKMQEFNLIYSDLLRDLHRAFNGEPERFGTTVSSMYELKDRAEELMRMPTGDGVTTAGPSFEFIDRLFSMSAGATGYRISIEKNGPYVVKGGTPLVRKSVVYSELHEPLTWKKEETISSDEKYRLCRCGKSSHKPFCDATHERIGFDGTEVAPTDPSEIRRERFPGTHVTLTDDQMLCTHAGFCGNRVEKVWSMIERTDDSRVRFQLMQMVERCPSGRLGYELEDGPIEPDLPTGIAVTKNGPLWVTGGIPVTMSDGRTLEPRNRVTLCRCGRSSNKPLCDGTHSAIKFRG